MKKALLLVGLLGATTAFAEDSYLYWMVGDPTPASYTVARVRDTATDRYLTVYDDTGSIGEDVSKAIIDSYKTYAPGEGLYASLASASSSPASSFIVELWSGDTFVAQSLPQQYLSQYITPGGIAPAATVWAASSFAIPEPNSAMLMLVGMAALGLRRRKLKKA